MIEAVEPRSADECARILRRIGRRLYRAGQLPATSGNLSLRIDDSLCAITASGRDKGQLSRTDILSVSLESGLPINHPTGHAGARAATTADTGELRPSAETPLHVGLYRSCQEVGAIFHTHSTAATVLSRLATGDEVVLDAYELAKAWRGVTGATTQLTFPVFDNDQDLHRLSATVLEDFRRRGRSPRYAYLIRSHGAYVWGQTWQEALRHLEALELMLACELATLQISGAMRGP